MRKLRPAAMLVLSMAILASCAATAAKPSTVNATLTDNMKIAVDRGSVPAGPVTFVVKNSGLLVHELVVIQTDLAQDKLPPDADEPGKADETGNVGESGDMTAGASKTFTITIPAGHYVLMCNEVGHYAGGMHLAFTVN